MRLHNRKPFYNKKEWEVHAKQHDAFLKMIREVTPPSSPRHRKNLSTVSLPITSESTQQDASSNENKPPVNQSSTTPKKGKNPKNKTTKQQQQQQPKKPFVITNPIEKMIVKIGKDFDGTYLIVTVSEITVPPKISIQTFDLDTSKAEKLDTPLPTIELMLKQTAEQQNDVTALSVLSLIKTSQREELARLLIGNLSIKPTLSLPANGILSLNMAYKGEALPASKSDLNPLNVKYTLFNS